MPVTRTLIALAAAALLAGCGAFAPAEPTPTRTPPWLGPTSTPSPTVTPTPEGRARSPREVEPAAQGQPADSLGLEPMTITGRIVDETGHPVSDAFVILGYWDVVKRTSDFVLYDPPGAEIYRGYDANTGANGEFRFTNVPPSVEVSGDRFVLLMPSEHYPCPPNCAYALQLGGQATLPQCQITDEAPPPLEDWLFFTVDEGEAVDLGDIVLIGENSTQCQSPLF